jgi:hypothetical protein
VEQKYFKHKEKTSPKNQLPPRQPSTTRNQPIQPIKSKQTTYESTLTKELPTVEEHKLDKKA